MNFLNFPDHISVEEGLSSCSHSKANSGGFLLLTAWKLTALYSHLATLITQVTEKMKPVVLPSPCWLPWCWAWVLPSAKEDLALFPNQTWVHSPNTQLRQIYRHWAVVKESTVVTARDPRWGQARRTGSSYAQKTQTPWWLSRKGFLKLYEGEGHTVYHQLLHSSDWLMGR